MKMPRSTEDILEHADELARRFEEYEPTDGDDAKVPPEVMLRLAVIHRAQAESEILEAVRAARAGSLSWKKIGETLGTSAQAASERYSSRI